jgi:hypothetical protein
MKSYEHCVKCGVELRKVSLVRVKATRCGECRANSRSYEFKRIMEECAKNSQPEEGRFEDIAFDPDEGVMHKSTKPRTEVGIKSSLGGL